MNRVRTLTMKAITYYKVAITSFLVMFLLFMIYFYSVNGRWWSGLIMVLPWGILMHKLWKNIKLIKEVSYDDLSIYVKHGEFEVQIPMYRVKEVSLVSLDGVYKFELLDKDQFGDVFYCKPSIWYPFTYKKVDDELHELRQSILKNKRTYSEARLNESGNILPGMNI